MRWPRTMALYARAAAVGTGRMRRRESINDIQGTSMKLCYALLLSVVIAPGAFAHGSGSDSTARNLAATCANCHGTEGHSVGAVAKLAGQPAQDMLAKLAEFKEGKRPATIMHQIAKGFTDQQLKLIADYFAAQK
jgi:cytochrome subunit of sulfide dehydrogenase